MRILLTGASSFTGFWFARHLAEAGHEVVAALPRAAALYQAGVRARRVAGLGAVARIAWDMRFGSDAMLDLVGAERFDVLAHHAAMVGDYRAADYDVLDAVAQNTRRLPDMLAAMKARGLRGVIATGSVFEQDEGAGEAPLRAFSLYGLSKGLTAQVIRYHCAALDVPLAKFVLPNPFGPFEEPRFCQYLVQAWRAGETAVVRTPAYVRDNLPVGLAAARYAAAVAALARQAQGFVRIAPSGYVESQGAFAERVARELGPRLGLQAKLALAEQAEFGEPLMRVNTETLLAGMPIRAIAAFWDDYASWYAGAQAPG